MRNLWMLLTVSLITVSCQQQYMATSTGAILQTDSVQLEIQFYTPEIVRVIKSSPGFDFKKESLSVIKTAEKVDFEMTSTDQLLELTTDRLTVMVDIKSGAISFSKPDGMKLLEEAKNGTKLKTKMDLGEPTFAVKQAFVLDTEEHVYGLGQYENGKMSQRNQTIHMTQSNRETVVPMMVSSKGYGVFWDNYSPTVFSDNTSETSFDSEVGDCVDYYVMAGENTDEVIAHMRDLTGQAPMMPYWTFGYWQSKERYKSQTEIVDVVKRYREMGVPLDGIIQDWQYWGDNYHWNAMEFLNPEFPDPQQMVNQIHEFNAHMIISIWSSFGPETPQYKQLSADSLLMDFATWPMSGVDVWPPDMNLPSGVKVYDPYHPKARDIYWNALKDGLYKYGMDGWWMDSTEPDHMDIKPEDLDNKTYLGSFRSVRNAFPLMTVGGVVSHQRAINSDKRIFILTRSAFAGQQRYAANSWSGDLVSDWDVLNQQIAAGLNFSMTGIPYWNSDIGGFFLWNFPGGYENKAFHELYVRWMQFGVFCPMMRSHGTDSPRELWYYGKPGDWTYDALLKMIKLRYSMLPYIYSNAWEVTSKGSSFMRALVMDFPNDPNALDINDQFMFGKNLLVCPVTEPMYVDFKKENNKYYGLNESFDSVKTVEVYLPAGTQWYDYWNGTLYAGGQNIRRAAPIDEIPLFVKAGSIIPFGPEVTFANEQIGPLTVRIYPGADASFTFYDDERDNYNYEKGAYATIDMKWDDTSRIFTMEAQKGKYAGMPENRAIKVVLVEDNQSQVLSAEKAITYDGSETKVNF